MNFVRISFSLQKMLLASFMFGISALSGVGCLATMIVIFFSKNLKTKFYNQVIFHIALSDGIFALGTSMGIPNDGSIACSIQAILTNIGPVGTLTWTTVLAYHVFAILAYPVSYSQRNITISNQLSSICWGIPIIVTILPLSTVKYGLMEGGWCYIKEGQHYKWTLHLWYVVSYFGWLYSAIIVYVALIFYVYFYHLRDPSKSTTAPHIIAVVRKLLWYPIILLCTWCVNTIYLFWIVVEPNRNLNTMGFVAMLIPLFSGFFTSIAFFVGGLRQSDWDSIRQRASDTMNAITVRYRSFGSRSSVKSSDSQGALPVSFGSSNSSSSTGPPLLNHQQASPPLHNSAIEEGREVEPHSADTHILMTDRPSESLLNLTRASDANSSVRRSEV
jgi:hypothetical protein